MCQNSAVSFPLHGYPLPSPCGHRKLWVHQPPAALECCISTPELALHVAHLVSPPYSFSEARSKYQFRNWINWG